MIYLAIGGNTDESVVRKIIEKYPDEDIIVVNLSGEEDYINDCLRSESSLIERLIANSMMIAEDCISVSDSYIRLPRAEVVYYPEPPVKACITKHIAKASKAVFRYMTRRGS